jgi:hypothetical protein
MTTTSERIGTSSQGAESQMSIGRRAVRMSGLTHSAWLMLFETDRQAWIDMAAQHRAVVDEADSPTHFVCEDAVEASGNPDATHHIRRVRGEEACSFCDRTAAKIREEVGL